MARLARPHQYDPDSPTLGLSDWEYELCRAIYQSASPATELLAERDAVPYRHCADVPDYWAELPEDKAPKGRVLLPRDASETMSDGGRVGIRTMSEAAERDGVVIRTGHRVQRMVVADGAVVGVEATTLDGASLRVRARKAVVFATGGFTHNKELRQNFLNVPVYGGCAALTNEGDFVAMASSVGAQLRNMNYAWMCPVPLEKAVARDPDLSGMFSVAGDSMIFVDKRGLRVVNEKLPYNGSRRRSSAGTRSPAPTVPGPDPCCWTSGPGPSASDEYGRLIVPPGTDDAHVVKGDTLAELAAGVAERLARYEGATGGLRLSEDFLPNLEASVARFNELAGQGVDDDFHRGERAVQLLFNGVVKEEPGRTNPTMWPISDTGPYYAALVTGGTLDTKGGPKTAADGQVVDDMDRPIPGLYGVGNCVASASAQAYWAGGATLGPIIALAYRAAKAAHAEPVRPLPVAAAP